MTETDILRLIEGRLDRVQSDVEEIKRYMRDHPNCPQPGLCLALQEGHDKLLKARDEQWKRITKLEKWQSWMMGAIAVLVVVMPFAFEWVHKMIG